MLSINKFDGKMIKGSERTIKNNGLVFKTIQPNKHIDITQRISNMGWSASAFFAKYDINMTSQEIEDLRTGKGNI